MDSQQYLGIFQSYFNGQLQNIAFRGAKEKLAQQKAKIEEFAGEFKIKRIARS